MGRSPLLHNGWLLSAKVIKILLLNLQIVVNNATNALEKTWFFAKIPLLYEIFFRRLQKKTKVGSFYLPASGGRNCFVFFEKDF